jgi:hypothetical protein
MRRSTRLFAPYRLFLDAFLLFGCGSHLASLGFLLLT